jgi:ATP-binding cassette, subfamily C, bacterial LapB
MWPFAGSRNRSGAGWNPQPRPGAELESGSGTLVVETRSLAHLLLESLHLPPSIILSSFAINLFGLALPLVVLQVFDRVLQHGSRNTLFLLIVGLFLTVAAEMTLRFARNRLIGRAALRECFDLQMRGAVGFLNAPRSTASSLTADRAFDAMSAIDEITRFLSGEARLALLDFPFILLFVGFIWAIGGMVAAMPLCLIVLFSAWTIWSSASFKRALKAQVDFDFDRYAFYAECLKGIATVKALAIEPQMQRRLEHLMHSSASVDYDLVLRANRIMASGQLFASLTMMSVVTAGGMLAIQGAITVGAVAACSLIANRVTQPVLRIIGLWGQLEAAQLARERFALLLALPAAPRLPPRRGAAAIQMVGLRLGDHAVGSERKAIDLKIEPGQVIGILNGDFAQRAELSDILRGQMRPRAGVVLIDGIDITGPDGQAALNDVFFLGSDPVVFRGSILDNISMFGQVRQTSAIAAARRVGLESVLRVLPEGYDTILGDVGATALPLDILQAMCIARAVVIRPRLLLLDLRRVPPDDVSTRACVRAIKELRGDVTIILFGESKQEVDDADRVFLLDNWRLEEMKADKTGPASQEAARTPSQDRAPVADDGRSEA